jgi:hypothetical protein
METGWCEKNRARARQLSAQCGGWWLVLFGEKAAGVLTLLADIGRTWPGIQKRGLESCHIARSCACHVENF